VVILLDKCSGCGMCDYDIVTKKGTKFLVCSYCGKNLGILEEEKPIPIYEFGNPYPVGEYRIACTGIYNPDLDLPIYSLTDERNQHVYSNQ